MAKISRKRKHLVMLPLCALFFFIGAVTVQAATFYVATTGNDAHTCATAQTISTPKRTIASGVACLNPGDTLYMRGGTYTQLMDVTNISGTASARITIRGYPGETVTLTAVSGDFPVVGLFHTSADYLTFAHFILDGTNGGNSVYWTISQNHDITLDTLEIKNWMGHGLLLAGDNFKILNCKIHHQRGLDQLGFRWYGIYFANGANGLIDGNEIYNNPGGGMQLYPGPHSNLIVRDNFVHHNNTLSLAAFGGILLQGTSTNPIANTQIYNNLVYRNATAGGASAGAGIVLGYNTKGTKVWNNTVYGNKGYGLQIGYDTTVINTVVQNNISYGNVAGNYTNAGSGTTEDHNHFTDPSFVNAAANDYTLQGSSPAIDAGAMLSQITRDIMNIPRPQGATYDIGAYERGTGLDSSAPASPVGLRIN